MFARLVKSFGLLVLALALSAPAARAETYKVGAIMAMTGAAAFYGTVMTRGAQLAIDEINAAGGINGNKLELVIEDHKGGKPQPAVSGMNRMINLHNVQAVLSSFSAPTLAIAPIADEKGVMILNGGGVSAKMIGASKYLFHNRSLATDLARALAVRAHERGFERMAQIGIKDEFGDSVIAEASRIWKKLGHTVVATEQYPQGAINVDTQIAKLRAAKPDVVANWGLTNEAGRIVKRMRDLGMEQPAISMEWGEEAKKAAGGTGDGTEVVSDFFAVTDDNPWGQRFAKAYKDKFGEDPEYYAANYYENIYVIAELLKRGAPWNGAAMADELRKNPTFDSVFGGKMTYQPNGVAIKRVGLFVVENGDRKFVKLTATKVD